MPKIETVSTESGITKNYSFTAIRYQFCGLSLEGVETNSIDNKYYVLVKQEDEYKHYARLNNLSDLRNTDGQYRVPNDIKGSTGYEFEIVYRNSDTMPSNIDELKYEPKMLDGCCIAINNIPYIISFPTQATTKNNYVFAATPAPQYSATFSFMQEDGVTPVENLVLTDTYYALIATNNRYSLSESPINFSQLSSLVTSTSVSFVHFYGSNGNDLGSLRYSGDPIQNIWLVSVPNGNSVPTVSEAVNQLGSDRKKELTNSTVWNGYGLTSSFTTGEWNGVFTKMPSYTANIQFVDSDGSTPIDDPELLGTYYYLVKANIGSERYAVSTEHVDFRGTTPGTFEAFYDRNDQNEQSPVSSVYSGTPITQAWLVSTNQSGKRPNVWEAANGQNGVTQYDVSSGAIFAERFTLSGVPDQTNQANYLITATRMPSYQIISSFVDGTGPVPKALSKGYYLAAKASINGSEYYYIDTYDPAREYEITHFYTEPDLNGSGNQYNGKTAYVNDSAVVVYLVEQSNVSSVDDVKNATDDNKISYGTVEIYTLAQTPGTNQTSLTFTKNAETETYATIIKFFTENAEIIEAAGDIGMHVNEANSTKKAPSLSKHYYVVATLINKTDKSIAGWAINPVTPSGHAETSTYFSEFIPFGADGSTTTGTKIPFSSSDDFPYDITTRLYRTDSALSIRTYKALVTDKTNSATDSAEDGYEFVGNWNPDATHNEIHLKEASAKTYAVRVRFKASDVSKLAAFGTGANEYFVVNVIVTHADSSQSVQYDRIQISASDISQLHVDEEGYYYKEFPFAYWRATNGGYYVKDDTKPNPKFTGNEQNIKVELVKSSDNNNYAFNNYESENSIKYTEGTSAGSYVVHYDTRWTNPQNTLSKFHEELDGTGVIKCYDLIDLIPPIADSEYDYSTILGPNYSYGIVADHLFQNNDLQTNFAVNHYTGHGDFITPDLSNTSGTIVIGEFNRNTDVMSTNHVGPAVDPASTDGEDIKAGTIPLGNTILGSLAIYADDDSGSRYETYGIDGGTPVAFERDNVHVSLQNGASLQSQIVNPGIQYGINMSRTLAAKSATYTPEIRSGKPYVITTGFPDNATIYIDADALLSGSGEQPDDVYGTLYVLDQLHIEKNPGQMLIFNFNKTKNVKLKQFHVKYEESYFDTQTTTSHSDINVKMEDISKHIVWNFASCTGRVELSEVGGICLQPNYGSETQISGTSGGWLVSAGYVFNSDAEWHNFFQEVPVSTEVNLNLLKTVDDLVPGGGDVFSFELYEYKIGMAWPETPLASTKNVRSSIKFNIKDKADTSEENRKLTPGWHIYKIVEDPTIPVGNTTNNQYIFDPTIYYAAVRVTQVGETVIAGMPMYFSDFNPALFNLTAVENVNKPAALTGDLVSVTFKNEVKKEGLTIQKTVEGTDSSKVSFTFKIKAWQGETGSTTALSGSATDYSVSGLPGTTKITLTPAGETGNQWSEGTLNLKNGQTATITNLPIGSHYEITETHVGGTEITYTDVNPNPVMGYTPQTGSRTGIIPDGGIKEAFVNKYQASGKTTLYVHKALKNSTATLPSNAYGFELYQVGGGKIGETQYNDDNGNVTFGPLIYTEADLEGAVVNPYTGKRVKVLSYRVHEVNGSLAKETFDYSQYINDSDKLVVVNLTDNGDGTITAATFPADATFRFNNEKAIQVVLEGSKILTGRDMKAGEVFRFVAKEDGTTVATASVTGARDSEEVQFRFTPIKYTEAGTHEYTITEVQGTDDKLNYDNTTSYTATVTVENNEGKLSATITYDEKKPFINTSKETKSASVEKVWSDGNQNHSNDRVKVKLYKAYGNPVEQAPTGTEPVPYIGTGTDTTETGGISISRPGTDYLPADAETITGTEVMLSRANGWKHVWSKLPTMENDGGTWKYVNYYPVEVWSSNANIVTTAYDHNTQINKVTITNTVASKGALKLTKAVTVNGQTPNAGQQNLTNGTYSFEIRKVGVDTVIHTVAITYAGGAITGATLDGQTIALSGSYVVVTNLNEGDYTITETAVSGMTTTASGGTGNSSTNTITVHVTAGDMAADQATAQAIFTNNKPYTTVAFRAKKTLQGAELANRAFSFALTEYTDASFKTVKSGGVEQSKTNFAPVSPAIYGEILFDDVDIISAGTRYFKISETIPTGEGADGTIIYDTMEYNITVTVTADSNGNLTATKSRGAVDGYDASFANIKTGSLKITKTLKINEADLTTGVDGTQNLADGIFTFEVWKGDGSAKATDKDGVEIPEVTITVTDGTSSPAEQSVSNLRPGSYLIVEKSASNNFTLFNNSAALTTANGKTGILVTVNAGDVGGIPTAAFVNNKNMGKISVTKTVTGITDESILQNTTYTFTISRTGMTDVTLNVKNGETKTTGWLELGDYTVTEASQSIAGYDIDTANTFSTQNVTLTTEHRTQALNIAATNTYIKTTNITVKKVKNDTTEPLSGATFKLYRVTTVEVTATDGGEPTTSTVETPYPNEADSQKTTNVNGTIQFANLIDGNYKIVETQPPAGYNALTQAIEFSITNGVVTYSQGSTVTYDPNTKTFTVPNTPGVELPATGGSGTLLYTIGGMTLILLAAGVLLAGRKRRKV